MTNSYPLNIPSESDTADIRKALLNYHYGLDSIPADDNFGDDSIAKYLQDVTAALLSAQNRLSSIAPLDSDVNINDTLANGIYYSPSGVTLTTLNYPTNTAGILTHVQNNANTARFQTYQTVSETGVRNGFWLRHAVNSLSGYTWAEWDRVSLSTHTHDDRYYTETEIDNKVNSLLGTSSLANKVLITDETGKIVGATTVTPTILEYLGGDTPVTSDIQPQINAINSTIDGLSNLYWQKSETARIYVQQSQPTTTVTNALWIW